MNSPDEQLIGTIAGQPVIGKLDRDTVSGTVTRYQAEVTIDGQVYITDGSDFIAAPAAGEMARGVTLAEWHRIYHLAQTPYFADFLALAREWCDT